MTDGNSGYTGPPAMGEPVDPYAGGGWGQQPPPYGPPPLPYYGYPQYGYNAMPPPVYGSARPGQATAAAVLGWVNSGFLIIASLFLFAGASVIHDFDDDNSYRHHNYAAEFTFDGFLNLVAAALLIAGGLMITSRAVNGRWLYSAGCLIVFGEAIYWMTRFSFLEGVGGFIFWAVVYLALAVVGVSLAWTSGVTKWLNRENERPVPTR